MPPHTRFGANKRADIESLLCVADVDALACGERVDTPAVVTGHPSRLRDAFKNVRMMYAPPIP